MSFFFTGDVVVARVTAQGMTKGESYLVADAIEQGTVLGGTFVTYILQRGDDRFAVVNLHVLADKVQPKKAPKVRVLRPRFDRDAEEWVVAVKLNGELCEARTYYTADKADALATYEAMRAEAGQPTRCGGCPTCKSTATLLDEEGTPVCESCGRILGGAS